MFVCFIWVNVTFNKLLVILLLCLGVAGTSMLAFRELPHWNYMPQTWLDIPSCHIIQKMGRPVLIPNSTLCWVPEKSTFSTIIKVFGMIWLMNKSTNSCTQSSHSTTVLVGKRHTIFTLSIQTNRTELGRLRSDATKCGIWSGSTMFATHPAVFIHIDR